MARAQGRDGPWLGGAVAASAGVHILIGLLFPHPAARPATHAVQHATEVIDIDTPPPPTRPAVEKPAPPAPAPKAPRAPAHKAPPTALAQAAKVVTRTPAATEPLDFGDTIVSGTASSFAGGITAATGTSKSVVREAPSPQAPAAAAGGTGSGANLSRSPRMAGESAWKCPFPAEATGVGEAFVQLRVFVGADGQALDAAVLADPGHGFGAAAVRCAIGTRWSPALDREGTPVRATALVRVRFTR
jgi:protein TonB